MAWTRQGKERDEIARSRAYVTRRATEDPGPDETAAVIEAARKRRNAVTCRVCRMTAEAQIMYEAVHGWDECRDLARMAAMHAAGRTIRAIAADPDGRLIFSYTPSEVRTRLIWAGVRMRKVGRKPGVGVLTA